MRKLGAGLAIAGLLGCVGVTYQGAGERITPRSGETLVFGRVRFLHDGREFFPWSASLTPSGVTTETERHLWLLRLGRRAVSAEVHPDEDGSLAIWLAPADYALLGSTELPSGGTAPFEVVAVLRVPAGPVAAYAGDLAFATVTHEGSYLTRGAFGTGAVTRLPIDLARKTLEQRLGTLPEAPVSSLWCAGEELPGFDDSDLGARAKALLDAGCVQGDSADPAKVPISGAGDSIVGHLVLGVSTSADAARLLAGHGGLGPSRQNDVTFQVGSKALHPPELYTPPGTMHQLYFSGDTLVLVVAGAPRGLPTTRSEFLARFPRARETQRESAWYELQTPLSDCIWLIAVFGTGTDRLDSAGYARICGPDRADRLVPHSQGFSWSRSTECFLLPGRARTVHRARLARAARHESRTPRSCLAAGDG